MFIQSCFAVCCFAQETESIIQKMMPEIPSEITAPSKRAAYLTQHFWDKFDFQDTTFLMTNQLLERSFVDFVDLMTLVPNDVVEQSIQSLLKKSEEDRNLFTYIIQLSTRYLYEPRSPLCNEETLIPFLKYALQSSLLDDTEKIRPAYLLNCISKNRIGSVANDFSYTLMNGETGKLHGVKSDFTLLYFNDPECDDCRTLIKQLNASTVINPFVESGKMTIIAVYVNDDLDAWKKHAPDVLHSWIYAYDAEQKINMEEIYHIKLFPTLYLLDQDKKVLLKDTTFENLEKYMKSHE